jgi:MtN3 and saliva related transmembrane protein
MNPMDHTELIGYVAATLTTIAFIPQVVHTWRQRSARGISLGMYAIFTCGVALWLVYSLLLAAWPLIVANSATLVLALAMLVMKLRYR